MPADSPDGAREFPIKIADDFLMKNSLLCDEATRDIDDLLFTIINKSDVNAQPLLCLRCRISHPIYLKLLNLHHKYKNQYFELEKADMASILLEDSGEIHSRGSQVTDSYSRKPSRKLLNWDVFLEIENEGYRPFGVEIIQTFNPERGANLSTWAQRKVLGNSELKKYFRSSGLILISPWALIADTSTRRVKKACDAYGIWGQEAKALEQIHTSYLIHYPEAKERYRKSNGKNYGWEPDIQFLQSLIPKQDSDEQLRKLDQVIRNFIVRKKNIFNLKVEEVDKCSGLCDLVGGDNDTNNDDNEALIESIASVLNTKALPILKETIDRDSLKWEEKPERKMVWELYSQGFSQREIASRCKKGQSFVSKLLKEKQLTESIAQESALELIQLPGFRSTSKDPEAVDRMIEALRIHLTSSEQQGSRTPLCQWISEIINL